MYDTQKGCILYLGLQYDLAYPYLTQYKFLFNFVFYSCFISTDIFIKDLLTTNSHKIIIKEN